jgi:hypothetical protein
MQISVLSSPAAEQNRLWHDQHPPLFSFWGRAQKGHKRGHKRGRESFSTRPEVLCSADRGHEGSIGDLTALPSAPATRARHTDGHAPPISLAPPIPLPSAGSKYTAATDAAAPRDHRPKSLTLYSGSLHPLCRQDTNPSSPPQDTLLPCLNKSRVPEHSPVRQPCFRPAVSPSIIPSTLSCVPITGADLTPPPDREFATVTFAKEISPFFKLSFVCNYVQYTDLRRSPVPTPHEFFKIFLETRPPNQLFLRTLHARGKGDPLYRKPPGSRTRVAHPCGAKIQNPKSKIENSLHR